MADPTPKQRLILEYIAQRFQEEGLGPTLRDIGGRFGVSVGTAQGQVKALEAKGLLRRAGGHRGIELLGPPILGRVGAGGGVIAQEAVEGRLGFKEFVLGTDFLLRVRGDSMDQAGILEGDLVQVRRQPTAEDGDIVVALVEEEGVVKRLRRSGRAFRLESANPKYPPIEIGFQVVGKVIGLVRRYGR